MNIYMCVRRPTPVRVDDFVVGKIYKAKFVPRSTGDGGQLIITGESGYEYRYGNIDNHMCFQLASVISKKDAEIINSI